METKKVISLIVAGILIVIGLSMLGKLVENVDAEEILVIQDPVDGELHWHVTPGLKAQWFGKTTKYPKRGTYRFECEEFVTKQVTDEEGSMRDEQVCNPDKDRRIRVRFNDGGHATMTGSMQFDMPLDELNLTRAHTKFATPEAIQKQLIETVMNKSMYMTGPLMSSKESYAEKRNALISFVEDQVEGGIYRTIQKEIRVPDPITGADKTITVVEIMTGADGLPQRQESAQLTAFGIKPFNFTITEVDYDEEVEAQIKQQQQLIMDVQTSVAQAKKSEQNAITVAEQGKADAAESKWKQEVIKAQAVTEAEQELAVAKLQREAAEQTKQKEILLGQGEAERKRLVMNADGQLTQKLEVYYKVQERWATAFEKHQGPLVPSVVMGGGQDSSRNASNTTSDLVNLLTIKTAKDLSLDLSVPKGNQGAQ
ncbi:MAG: SPFH domain-containing protein [bacterium]|nr:SPFH domain-containing protein [bacterium]